MRFIFLFLLSFIFVGNTNAQISVESFSMVDNDLDARNFPILDDDGSACALIKIVTTTKNFNFEIGQLPIKKIDENHVGEIWVYVPEGTMKLKINHADLGSLKGADVEDGYYIFSQRLKKAKCYRMVLTHKEVIKMVGIQEPGRLIFECNVEGAEVFLGENEISQGIMNGNSLAITWPREQIVKYRIHKNKYEDVAGVVKVGEITNVSIALKPLFAIVNVSSISGATIYIDGKRYGVGQVSVELSPGTYSFKAVMNGYHDASNTITLKRGDVINLLLNPDIVKGSANIITSPYNADVYIDGKHVGYTPLNVNLEVGKHQLELKKSQYVSIRKTLNIIGEKTINVNESLTTKVKVQRLKDKAEQNQFTFSGSVDIISSNSVQLGIEGYFPKILGLTFELGGFYVFTKTDECKWHDIKSDLVGIATYNSLGFYSNMGFGIKAGLHFRITPYVGIKYITLMSDWENVGYSFEDPAKDSNAVGAMVGCKFSYLLNEHFQTFISPNYSLGIGKSDGYRVLYAEQPIIKNSLEGFNIRCGLSYVF